jgi:sigma54-dependent transcription regulator
LVAHAIHSQSERNRAMIEVNCAAIPSELIESELFGHVKVLLRELSKTSKENLNWQMEALFFRRNWRYEFGGSGKST